MGASRIHGELLKLGFEIADSTVSKYMIQHRGPPSQSWATFLRTTRMQLRRSILRGSNRDIRVPVCVSRHRPRSTTTALVCHYGAPDCRMGGAADRGGISAGYAAEKLVRDNDGAYGQTFKVGSALSGYGIGRSHRGRPGRTPMSSA